MSAALEACPGCGARLAAEAGPTHPYMLSSAACWRRFGELLALEYENPVRMTSSHRLSVDAYALQHPGNPDEPRAQRSVWLHYCSLMLVLDYGASHESARSALQALSGFKFPALPAPPDSFSLTVADLSLETDASHNASVVAWAQSSFDAWDTLASAARTALQAAGLGRAQITKESATS